MTAAPVSVADDGLFGRAIAADAWAARRRAANRPLMPPSQIFHGYQRQLLATTAVNRVTVYEKSRRTGVTWAAAYDFVMTASKARSARGMNCFYIGYNLEMAREFIDACAMWARELDKAAGEIGEYLFEDTKGNKDVKAFSISFASGFSIRALPSRPRSLRGMQGYVCVDEAAFHEDFPELMKAALALLLRGGKLLIISTHDGELNPFNQLIGDIRSGRKKYALLRTDFDEALMDGLYERLCQQQGEVWSPEKEAAWRAGILDDFGDVADEELYVIPSEGSGTAILPAVLDKAARNIPVLRWDEAASFAAKPEADRRSAGQAFLDDVVKPHWNRVDEKALTFFGFDFALVADRSVFWPVQLVAGAADQAPLVRRPPFVIEFGNIPYDQQKQVLWWVLDRLGFAVGAMDATGNGAPLAQEAAQRYGEERIVQVKINVGWYRDVMPLMKEALEAQGFELPADPEIHGDFRSLKKIDGIIQLPKTRTNTKGEGGKAGKRRHGDAAIAGALAEMASLVPIGEYDYRPAGGIADTAPMPHSRDDDEPSGRSIW